MKYRVTLDGEEREVDVAITPGGSVSVSLDGAPVDAHATRVPGGVNLIINGHVFDLAIGGKPDALHVAMREDRAVVSVQSERSRSSKKSGAGAANAGREIRSPMPGRVVKVLVNVGDVVEPHAPVIVVEAMKMENELRAPAGGKVESLHAKAGDTVEGGALLVRFAK